ncbi:hypothetical protein LINGRAHAP2_LOCUS14259 [Linum grandiflorum]
MRVRVELDVCKPLRRETKVRLHDDVQLMCPLCYERLQTFCYIYGIMGPTDKFWGTRSISASLLTRSYDVGMIQFEQSFGMNIKN